MLFVCCTCRDSRALNRPSDNRPSHFKRIFYTEMLAPTPDISTQCLKSYICQAAKVTPVRRKQYCKGKQSHKQYITFLINRNVVRFHLVLGSHAIRVYLLHEYKCIHQCLCVCGRTNNIAHRTRFLSLHAKNGWLLFVFGARRVRFTRFRLNLYKTSEKKVLSLLRSLTTNYIHVIQVNKVIHNKPKQ